MTPGLEENLKSADSYKSLNKFGRIKLWQFRSKFKKKKPILKVGNPRYWIPQWMNQDENIIKDLNNNDKGSLTVFFFPNWNGIINQIQDKVIFYEKYLRNILEHTLQIQ